jgi:sugar phosphate isomerase/epimerase
MKLTLKKNILPAFAGDVTCSLEVVTRIQSETGIRAGQDLHGIKIDYGFEAIIRPEHMEQLDKVEENLKPCKDGEYGLSIHGPLYFQQPEKMDLVNGEGARTAERLIEFADRNNISLIVAHPGMIRVPEKFAGYSLQQREEDLIKLAGVVKRLNGYSSRVCFSIENKPNPATDEKTEGLLISPVATSYNQLVQLADSGAPLTFDTAHYATTRAAINGIIASATGRGEELGEALKGTWGFFAQDCVVQPEISRVLSKLGDSVRQIHLNDSALYQSFGKMVTQWEGLIPGRGSNVNYSDVTRFLKSRKNDILVVMEVMERDYQKCPNTLESMCEFLRLITLSHK